MTGKALLFINGVPPRVLPDSSDYALVACTDGAFNYLKKMHFPLAELDFISGDFDSRTRLEADLYEEKFIYTPDQDKTDFEKALEILTERGVTAVDVYGGSGGEMDHFLGNLTVALQFTPLITLNFYDETSRYFFAPKHLVLKKMKDRLVSLFPFPTATNVSTTGLKWPLKQETLDLTGRIGTRNIASDDEVSISFSDGNLIVFVGHRSLTAF